MTKSYFSSLNYTLGNEDTNFEIQVLKKFQGHKVLSVAGSGGRALPLLTEGTSTLCCADLSQEQLYLTQLRESCYKNLAYEEFAIFF